jgi:hypothetical protein
MCVNAALRGLLAAALLCLFIQAPATAEDSSPPANAISLQGGYRYIEDSDAASFWDLETDTAWDVALSYERRLAGWLGVQLAVGYSPWEDTSRILPNETLEAELESAYAAVSVLVHVPLGSRVELYAGGGPDFYFTEADFAYRMASGTLRGDENFETLGAHALAGVELLLSRPPRAKSYEWTVPAGIFIEYRYLNLTIEDADQVLAEALNRSTGTSLEPRDLDLGGHQLWLGMRWHF